MLSKNLELSVMKAINSAFSDVESKNKIIIPSQVRSLLTELVRESLIFGEERWRKEDLDLILPQNFENVAARCYKAVSDVLEDAGNESQYVPGYLSLINTVWAIFGRLCFYPFCKPGA